MFPNYGSGQVGALNYQILPCDSKHRWADRGRPLKMEKGLLDPLKTNRHFVPARFGAKDNRRLAFQLKEIGLV